MKKIVYILVALFMTLFVACTQEESVETLNGDSRVNFSLKLPSSVGVRKAQCATNPPIVAGLFSDFSREYSTA